MNIPYLPALFMHSSSRFLCGTAFSVPYGPVTTNKWIPFFISVNSQNIPAAGGTCSMSAVSHEPLIRGAAGSIVSTV